ncbi:otoancorin [Channa argus]|uniref:otoancorin n=1 Tax=Channa argus TaxID=215402 RepID=UPI00352191E6
MAPKRGTFFCLLIVTLTSLAISLDAMSGMKPDISDVSKKLMAKCQNDGYQVPKMIMLSAIFNNSDFPVVDTFLSTFVNVLNSSTADINKGSHSPVSMDNKMANNMWNYTHLPKIVRLMKNLSEASACYIRAFMAPLSWTALTTQGEHNMSSDDYDILLWAAKPALQEMIFSGISLPPKIDSQNLEKMMKMLQEMYDSMSEDQKTNVVKWAKEQIMQNYFNCTMRPSPDSELMESCRSSLPWLNLHALTMMGPYLFNLAPDNFDSCPTEKFCEYFLSAHSNATFIRTTKINSSLGNMFLQRIHECLSGMEKLADHVDKLGALACYYYNATDLTPDFSKKFLYQLNNCDSNSRVMQLKKRLVDFLMTNSNITQALCDLGSNVALLSPEQLSTIPSTVLEEVLKKLGLNVPWTPSQLAALFKKQLGDNKCNEMSAKELMALQSVGEGLPSCVLKQVKARDILNDTEALKNISKGMSKGQLKAMLQGLIGDVDLSELVQKLTGPLLHSISLTKLKKANITCLDQVMNKTWSRSQAAYLAKKMQDLNQLQLYGRLHSISQGLTCKMIDNVRDNSTQDMALAITENPQWLSKKQANCVAQRLFGALDKERANYFKTITGDELKNVPTLLLLHLPPSKVMDLPDSVCPVFLDKMKEAKLSSLPLRSPCRPALTQKALLCLGKNVSQLTSEDVSRLGPLLCELPASQLRLMSPDVLNSSLLAMASCQFIPQLQRAEVINLVCQSFGDPSYWRSETMKALCPILLLDENVTSALPNKPWMKDILYMLKSHQSYVSNALKKKFFDLTTSSSKSNTARKKRGANGINGEAPTVELIKTLGMESVYWPAEQLNMMSNDTFLPSLETLGAVSGYDADQLAVLIKKATEVFGPVSQMNASSVIQMGCICRGLSSSDLNKLPFPLDSLENIAHCGWNESQMEAVWKAVAKHNNLTAQQLGAAEIVALNQFICGLNSSEIGYLNKEAFKDAVGSLDGVQCSFKVTQSLKNLAVSAFGDPSTWTEAQVAELDNIIAGLNANELAALDASVLSFISKSCIPLIPPANFAALSITQLEALGPDNAASVTTEQRAALKKDQQAALQLAETGSFARSQNSTQSGAPSLSVEGISAFIKPFFFLLMGFLLL